MELLMFYNQDTKSQSDKVSWFYFEKLKGNLKNVDFLFKKTCFKGRENRIKGRSLRKNTQETLS